MAGCRNDGIRKARLKRCTFALIDRMSKHDRTGILCLRARIVAASVVDHHHGKPKRSHLRDHLADTLASVEGRDKDQGAFHPRHVAHFERFQHITPP